jgi:hypothetical protein
MELQVIEDMRQWLKECFETEEDHEEIDAATQERIIKAVEREYSGGVKQFLLDSIPVMMGESA